MTQLLEAARPPTSEAISSEDAHCFPGLSLPSSPLASSGMVDEAHLATLIDTTRPYVPCMYDYYLGGHYNSAADRATAQKALDAVPAITLMARMNRGCLRRAVRFMARQGVRQFLDIGSGLPTNGNTHEIAHEVLGQGNASVVYVDSEPVVKILGAHILASDESTAVVVESCTNPLAILRNPDVKRLIDFSRPVGILMFSLLHFFPDEQLPSILDPIRDAVCPESYFAASQTCTPQGGYKWGKENETTVVAQYKAASTDTFSRHHQDIVDKIFTAEGWDMQEPGLVNVGVWRAADDDVVEGDIDDCSLFAALTKKL